MNVIDEFRSGIFSLHTVRFGRVAEIMVQKLFGMENSNTLKYDKILDGERIECKFSRALRENEETIKPANVLESCRKANYENRVFSSEEAESVPFDCNIQQVKRKEFDKLYYGIFFIDKIEIYVISAEEIFGLDNYSDKQHRGNIGEGQFHISNGNIKYHRERYLSAELTYEELYNLFS